MAFLRSLLAAVCAAALVTSATAAPTAAAAAAATAAAGPARGAAPPQAAEEGADLGAQRWRSGDRDGALAAWTAALEDGDALSSAERARLAYNLGIAEYERGAPLRAVAWFEAALRAAPRDRDVRANLAIARAEAGLEPRSGDDLTATFVRFASSFSRAEAEWFALLGALLLALAGLGEALRGGSRWRRVLLAAALAQVAFFAPLVRHVATADERPYMIVDPDGASARAEPAPGADRLETIPAGSVVDYVDALPGWTKVRHGGQERWVEAASVFDLQV